MTGRNGQSVLCYWGTVLMDNLPGRHFTLRIHATLALPSVPVRGTLTFTSEEADSPGMINICRRGRGFSRWRTVSTEHNANRTEYDRTTDTARAIDRPVTFSTVTQSKQSCRPARPPAKGVARWTRRLRGKARKKDKQGKSATSHETSEPHTGTHTRTSSHLRRYKWKWPTTEQTKQTGERRRCKWNRRIGTVRRRRIKALQDHNFL
jgi:hypothetical protein